MVKPRRSLWPAILAATLALQTLTGCGALKKWWGEEAEKPGVIQLPSSKAECPGVDLIIEGTDAQSERAFECWAAQLAPIWTDVSGQEKAALSDEEITVLIRKGAIDAGANPEVVLRKIFAAKKLLGIGSPLRRADLDKWVELLRKHRGRIRMILSAFTGKSDPLSYAGVRASARTLSEILHTMSWSMDSDEFVRTLRELIDVSNPDVRNAMIPAARAAINLLNAMCPTFTAKDLWITNDLGSCLVRAVDHFELGAPWFDFVIHTERRYSNDDVRAIRIALELLNQQFDTWFKQKELSPVLTARWIDLSRSLGVDPPADILSALELVNRFHKYSSGAEIDPTAFAGIFNIVRRFHLNLLEGMPYFLRALDANQCVNAEARNWTECVPKNLNEIRARSGVIDLAARVANPRYGASAVPFDGSRFARVTLFHVLSGRIIQAFDEDHDGAKDGLISAENKKGDNEVARLITVGLRGYETVRGFMGNIARKWKSLPVEPVSDARIVDLAGLARLITMAHDVLVQRTPENRSALEGVIANLVNAFPGSAFYLDQMSVTAVIVLADELTDFRGQYLSDLPEADRQKALQPAGQETGTISRAALKTALPEMLRRNFPRTYESCKEFGFEASCAIAFDGLLPDSAKDSEAVFVNDLDILTIAAAATEGLLDTCDFDGNALLSWSAVNGNDELDCGFVKMKDVLKRLIEVDVIHTNSTNRALANFALETINSTFVTRVIGKVALVRGTREYVMLNWPLFFLYDDASIGSILGLVADIMDQDLAKEGRKQAKRERKAAEKEKKAAEKERKRRQAEAAAAAGAPVPGAVAWGHEGL